MLLCIICLNQVYTLNGLYANMKPISLTNWLLFGIFLSSLMTSIVWIVIGFGVNHTLQVVPRTLTSLSKPESLKMVHGISQNVRDSLVTVMDDLNHDGALKHMNRDLGKHLHVIHNLVHMTVPMSKRFPKDQFFNESIKWRNTTNHILEYLKGNPHILKRIQKIVSVLEKDIPFQKMVTESHEWHTLIDQVLAKLKS